MYSRAPSNSPFGQRIQPHVVVRARGPTAARPPARHSSCRARTKLGLGEPLAPIIQ